MHKALIANWWSFIHVTPQAWLLQYFLYASLLSLSLSSILQCLSFIACHSSPTLASRGTKMVIQEFGWYRVQHICYPRNKWMNHTMFSLLFMKEFVGRKFYCTKSLKSSTALGLQICMFKVHTDNQLPKKKTNKFIDRRGVPMPIHFQVC
jgi:hypothetical protein